MVIKMREAMGSTTLLWLTPSSMLRPATVMQCIVFVNLLPRVAIYYYERCRQKCNFQRHASNT